MDWLTAHFGSHDGNSELKKSIIQLLK